MISYICLSLFIILVYVSGSKLNSIDIPSSQFINKDIVRRTTFNDNTTTTATTATTTFTTLAIITTQSSVTIEQQLSARASVSGVASSSGTISTIPTNFIVKKDHYNSLHLSKSSSSASASSSSSSSTSTPSTVLVSSTLSNIESPSTYFPLPIELPTITNTRTATGTTTTTAAVAAAPADVAAQTISNVGYINITSQAGTHVYLPCNVKQLVDRPISWIRIRDGHILTVDQTTFIADERFQSVYTDNPDRRWSLSIKYVQPRDSGSYECQVSTEPKMSARIHLNVIEPKTELLGESIRHVKAGSRVILRCIVSGGLEPPLYINWYFNKKQIILNNRNSWIIELNNHTLNGINTSHSYNTNDLKPNTIASLIIPSVTKKDSGNYTCSPSNSESITIVLHVLNGEYSASAITSGCSSNNIFHHKNLHNNHHLLVYHHHQHHHHNHHVNHLNRHHHYHHHRPNHHIKNHHYYSYYYHYYYYQFYYKYYCNHSIIIILLLLHHLHRVLFNDNKIKYNNLIKIFIILFLFQFIFYNNNYYNTKLLRM